MGSVITIALTIIKQEEELPKLASIKVKKMLHYVRSENDPLSSHTREPTTLSVITGNQGRRAFFLRKFERFFTRRRQRMAKCGPERLKDNRWHHWSLL